DRRPQHQPQVAADRHRRAERLARAEVVRPGIDAAAIDPDHVGAAFEPRRERSLGKAIAENAARRQPPKFLALGVLLRGRRGQLTTGRTPPTPGRPLWREWEGARPGF